MATKRLADFTYHLEEVEDMLLLLAEKTGHINGANEITPWIVWFIKRTLDAQIEAEEQIDFTLKKVKFFDKFKDRFNDRQHVC